MRGASWQFWGLCASAGVLSILTGCASVTHGTTQAVKIETLTANGQTVDGAECRLSNDKGEAVTMSGQSVSVRRSSGNLSIECTQPGQSPAGGQAVSRVNGGMVGNIVIGGLVGAAIDASNGAGFNYPSWMQLVFGEQRYFDRNSQQNDMPLAGFAVGTTQVAAKKEEREVVAGGARAPIAPSPRVDSAPAPKVSMEDLDALLPSKP